MRLATTTAHCQSFVAEWTIYSISDRTGIRYVGITSQPLERRARQHQRWSRTNQKKVAWINRGARTFAEIGRVICEREFAHVLEKRLSKSLAASGARLLNREARGL